MRFPMSLGALFMVALVAACTGVGTSSTPPSLSEDPHQIDLDRLKSVDSVSMSSDRRSVFLVFIGSPPYVEKDACTADYKGWAEASVGVLEVAVIVVIDRFEHGSGVTCTDLGWNREVVVELDEPFLGNTVRDLAGGSFTIPSPVN